MGAIYRSLAAYGPLIYILLAIMALYVFRRMWRSWREWRDAVFSLEREFALRRLGQATAFGLLVLLLFFGEFYISVFVVPSLPAPDVMTTPTLDLLATSIETTPANGAASPGAPSIQTGMSGCVENQIMLTAPLPGEEVSGTVTLTGTADIPNFGFYKYEIAPVGTGAFVTISAGAQPVRDGELGKWDTAALTNGDYFLQLVIIDNVGRTMEPCIIAVRVANQ
ncbi:MAG: Gmad2 immunoglobulin-like domain-containing protein [Anaerolineales bacterium]|nr:Gmad2 immunoglobulin-like domain-containing protein [Anaerolineales bacterium]NUQ84169.1 hypothetical protein [Anaerolineales bacterium]